MACCAATASRGSATSCSRKTSRRRSSGRGTASWATGACTRTSGPARFPSEIAKEDSMRNESESISRLRRQLLVGGASALAAGALGSLSRTAHAQAGSIDLPMINGHRNLVAFPEKRPLIVLTTRPPQLETPFEVFNEGVITPNDTFFVRYHNAGIPTAVDADKHLIKVGGNAAGKSFDLTLNELRTQFKPVEVVAVNQCSGNSRAFFTPRVTGGQLGNGAMGNARWLGVPLKDVLARAELKNTARQVTFDGLDPELLGGTDFVTSHV